MSEQSFIRSQLIETERLLQAAAAHPIMGPNLRSRRAELASRLETFPPPAPEASATLFFTGGPVFGSAGIEAEFAADVLKPFAKMVKVQFAEARNASPDARRPRRDPFDSKLMLTGLPRGSFGLELTPSGQTRPGDSQAIGDVFSQLSTLFSASAESDAAFADATADSPARLLVALRDLLKAVSGRNADLRFVTGGQEVRLARETIGTAYERVRQTVADEQVQRVHGVSRGIALDSARFDFRTADGDVISGFLADEVDERQAERMAAMATLECVAVLRVTSITSRGGGKRTKYELLDLEAETQPTRPNLL